MSDPRTDSPDVTRQRALNNAVEAYRDAEALVTTTERAAERAALVLYESRRKHKQVRNALTKEGSEAT